MVHYGSVRLLCRPLPKIRGNMELLYKLEHFEGPLDLLLHLIEKDKINIYDIPIVHITNQYLEYVRQMGEDVELMSEFLVMAATLLDAFAKE